MYLKPWLAGIGNRVRSHRSSSRRINRRPNQFVQCESLEPRTLLTVNALLLNGSELVVVSDRDDAITVRADLTGNVQVLDDGFPIFVGQIAAASLTKIEIVGGDADNTLDVSGVNLTQFTALTTIEIDGGDGNDTIIGSNDFGELIDGDDGDDTITGGGGNDTIDGDDGDDMIFGGLGNDSLDGGDGIDNIIGDVGQDTIRGGHGNDILDGGFEGDSIDGGQGDDIITGADGNDSIIGGSGNDLITGGIGIDTILGGANNDTINGNDGNDLLFGQGGDDLIFGDVGNDMIEGDDGNNSLFGGVGNDFILGDLGDDSIEGDSGNDTIFAGGGNDFANGGLGDDIVSGNSGNDTLVGGFGIDNLQGGRGDDSLQSVLATVAIIDAVFDPEGDVGQTGTLQFTLALSVPVNAPIVVTYATADGTALAGQDYVGVTGLITFAPNQISQTINVVIMGDTAIEGNESFLLNLTNISGPATLANAQATGIIVDDELTLPIINIDGILQPPMGAQRPDTVGDVGPNHYVQAAHGLDAFGNFQSEFVVFDKTGNLLQGPRTFRSLAAGFPFDNGLGDPIVQYDQFADRWLLVEGVGSNINVFVSQTSDPTGNYYAYTATTSGTNFPHFQKVAIYPDAYVITVEERLFVNSNHAATSTFAMDRINMLQGLAERPTQRFTVPDLAGWIPGNQLQTLTPADPDGPAPQLGTGALLMRQRDDELHNPGLNNPTSDFLEVYELIVDFDNAANSGLTQIADVPVGEFDSIFSTQLAINQPAPGLDLQTLESFINNRLQYRNFGAHETLVGNFTVDVGVDQAGLRWFELRRVGAGPWTVFQEGTQAPDSSDRWFGAISMDANGNIALAYNVSSSTVFPSLRYTGRLAGDPLGTMTQGELVIVDGTGSQTSAPFFGDYSVMSVDPSDDRTFWFTGEYIVAGGNWSTRIATFAFGGVVPIVSMTNAFDNGDTINGGSGDDTLFGAFGNDLLIGDDGRDQLTGNEGDDTILGGSGNDMVNGAAGNDSLDGETGNDSLDGGAGFDEIIWTGTGSGIDVILPATGSASVVITTSNLANTISVEKAGKFLRVAEGADSITTSLTVNSVTINTGDGNDTINVQSLNGINLLNVSINGQAGNDTITGTGSSVGLLRIVMDGGDDNDAISGTLGNDIIRGGDGNDIVNGSGGNDTIDGGFGNDLLNGEEDRDSIDGGVGNDTIFGGDGNDVARGGFGNDFINGDSGNDDVRGGEGDDVVVGSFGNDVLRGDNGKDSLFGGTGNDSLHGGNGDDYLRGHSGFDQIKGGDGNDEITGDAGDDIIDGGDGNDMITDSDGLNTLSGGDGDDVIVGGLNDDTILGGDGNDQIYAGGGRDLVFGEDGDDTLRGNSGKDRFSTGEGNDVIGDQGANEVVGDFANIFQAMKLAFASLTF